VSQAAYEPVIGLEIHVQLATRTKLFCGDLAEFGGEPNTRVCPVCLGLPGALPVLSARAVDLGARAALALGCRVQETSVFARKNYFYPDLPKGYQITQFEQPLAVDGRLAVDPADPTSQDAMDRLARTIDRDKVNSVVLTSGRNDVLVGATEILGGQPASVLRPRAGDFSEIQHIANHIFSPDIGRTITATAESAAPDPTPTATPTPSPSSQPPSVPPRPLRSRRPGTAGH
jgi:hypothetical protein